eukprot:4771949-Pyramimonas_sp.AAC.3
MSDTFMRVECFVSRSGFICYLRGTIDRACGHLSVVSNNYFNILSLGSWGSNTARPDFEPYRNAYSYTADGSRMHN